ncbi:hypothetical protein FOZ62_011014, partial [Perkinsus olseni]
LLRLPSITDSQEGRGISCLYRSPPLLVLGGGHNIDSGELGSVASHMVDKGRSRNINTVSVAVAKLGLDRVSPADHPVAPYCQDLQQEAHQDTERPVALPEEASGREESPAGLVLAERSLLQRPIPSAVVTVPDVYTGGNSFASSGSDQEQQQQQGYPLLGVRAVLGEPNPPRSSDYYSILLLSSENLECVI